MTKVAFKGGMLIDGTGETVEDYLIIIDGKKIQYA